MILKSDWILLIIVMLLISAINSVKLKRRSPKLSIPILDYIKNISKFKETSDNNPINRKDCIPTVKLDRCNTEENTDSKWQWKRTSNYHIVAQVIKSCNTSILSYKWKLSKLNGKSVQRLSRFKNQDFFVLSPFAVGTGEYYLHVIVSENKRKKISAKCLITIVDAVPTAIIDYGEKTRYDHSDQDIFFRGDRSIDNHFAPWENVDLDYRWSCVAIPYNNFCSMESKGKNITIPAQFATIGTEYNITLRVTAGNNKSHSVSQLVRLYRQIGNISIECVKNCGNIIRNNYVIYLKSSCSSCPNIADNLEWTIEPWPTEQNKSAIAQHGLNSPKLIIKPNVLKNNFAYMVTVYYYDLSVNDGKKKLLGKEKFNLTTSQRPNEGFCSIDPTTGGFSTTTLYTLLCWGINHILPVEYWIYYETEDRKKFFLAWTAARMNSFHLPGVKQPVAKQGGLTDWNYRTIFVDAYDFRGLQTLNTVSVLVAVSYNLSNWEEIENIVSGNNTDFLSIEIAIDYVLLNNACQTIFVVSQELRRVNQLYKKNVARQLEIQAKIVQILDKAKTVRMESVLIIATALNDISQEYNRTVAASTSQLILKLAEKQYDIMQQCPHWEFRDICSTRFRQEYRREFTLKALVQATSVFRENFRSEFSMENLVFNVHEYFPPINLIAITEEYPNYDDTNFGYTNLLKYFLEIVNNLEKANQYAGLQYAYSLAAGEVPQHLEIVSDKGHITKFIVASNTGIDYSTEKFTIEEGGTEILPSEGVKALGEEEVFAVIIQYEVAPYWWLNQDIFNKKKFLVQNFYPNGEKLKKLHSFTEQFYTTGDAGLEYHNESVSMPPKNQWTEYLIETSMTVHRIRVLNSTGLIIKFNKLNKTKLQVTLKYNSRPTFADIQIYTIISSSMAELMTTIPKSEVKYGHAWLYIAVLPESDIKRSAANEETIEYQIGFTSPKCLFLDEEILKWIEGPCTVGPEIEEHKLHCLCTSQGHFAFNFNPVMYKREFYFEPSITMNTSANSIMIFFIFYVFLCYCIALCFAIGSTWRFVYFATDNLVEDLYGYLIVIKTGDMKGAGTTSNIGIKLFGKELRTRSHLLNYPDPSKHLMQKGNQDFVIITSESHLGDIQHIFLWHDSVGLEPSWYCEWIIIKDLQTHQEWYFNINEWFCVIHGKANFIKAEPTTEKYPKTNGCIAWIKKFLLHFRFFHTWSIFRKYQGYDLKYVERLTLVLAAIYTTTVFAISVHGTPKLTVYDSYGNGHFQFSSRIILYGTLAAIPAFLFHLAFTIIFRSRNYNIFQVVSFDLVWLGWFLISVHVVLCIILLVRYAIWLSFTAGVEILLSVLVGLLISIFILESIYIVCRLQRNKIPNVRIAADKIVIEVENQRSTLYPMFGNKLLLPYLSDKYRPLTREEWLQKRQKEKARFTIMRRFFDLFKISIFLILLFFLVYISRRDLDVYSNLKMHEMTSGYFTKEPRFHNIATFEDFIDYLNTTLTIVTGPTKWYSNFNLVNPGIMIDYCTKILGVVKIRQLRVCQDCCGLADPVKHINWTCNPEYESSHSIKGKFMEYWEPYEDNFPTTTLGSLRDDSEISSDNPINRVERMKSSWLYEDEPIPTRGYITTYPGGGYSAPLGRHLYNTYYNIKYLVKSKWFDTKSRAVFIEFITYNPNYNVFNGVKLILEESATGLWVTTYQIDTLRLLFLNDEPKLMFSIIFPTFVLVVFLIIVFFISGMSDRYTVFWKNGWNYFDFFLLAFCVCCIYYYYRKIKAVEHFLEKVSKAQHNEIVFYDNIVNVNQTLSLLVGLLICLATIRIWRLLKFGKKFTMMEQTISYSAKSLMALIICHMIIVCIYTCVGYVVFVGEYKGFRHFLQSFTTVIILATRFSQAFIMTIGNNSYTRFVYFYYISYVLFSLIIFVLYIAIISTGYHKTRNKTSNLKGYYTTTRFLRDKSQYELESMRQKLHAQHLRMHGGAEVGEEVLEKKVRPKADEHRYAHLISMTSYKLSCMKFIAKSIIINKCSAIKEHLVSNSRKSLIDQVVNLILSRNRYMVKKEYVYVVIDAKHKPRVIENDKIVEMEYISDYIINSGTRINSIKTYFDKIIIRKEELNEKEEDVDSVEEFEDRMNWIVDELRSILQIMNNIRIVKLEPGHAIISNISKSY